MDQNPVILYVEDDAKSRTIMNLLLKSRMGLQHVTIFEDSTDFLSHLRSLNPVPNIIFLDIHVKPYNGFEMLAMLRLDPVFRQTPVVALTASVMNEEVQQLRTMGFDGCLAKPIDLDTFPEILERLLNGGNDLADYRLIKVDGVMLLKDKLFYIVEDNTQNRVVFQMCLLREGARVEFERQGKEAVQHLLSIRNVDIILLDLMLAKGVSGFDIYDDIRALPQFALLPIVAVSAMDPAIALPQVRRKGFNGFISKPIDGETFSTQVAQILAGEQVWDAGGTKSI